MFLFNSFRYDVSLCGKNSSSSLPDRCNKSLTCFCISVHLYLKRYIYTVHSSVSSAVVTRGYSVEYLCSARVIILNYNLYYRWWSVPNTRSRTISPYYLHRYTQTINSFWDRRLCYKRDFMKKIVNYIMRKKNWKRGKNVCFIFYCLYLFRSINNTIVCKTRVLNNFLSLIIFF